MSHLAFKKYRFYYQLEHSVKPLSEFIDASKLMRTYIVTNSSDTDGCNAIVRSKSALVAPIPTAIAAI